MRLRQRIQGRSTLEAPVDASLRRLGQLLVVMGALLGAVLGVALALLVENAETSRAVAAPTRERVAVLAASPPEQPSPAAPAGSAGNAGDGNDSLGSQRAESADRDDKRDRNVDKNSEGRRDKAGGRGKDKPSKGNDK